jgi:hypothetical protein
MCSVDSMQDKYRKVYKVHKEHKKQIAVCGNVDKTMYGKKKKRKKLLFST